VSWQQAFVLKLHYLVEGVVERRSSATTSQVVDIFVVFLFFPQGEVLLEQLNDALCVTEVILLEFVDLIESRLEGGVRKLASLGVVLKHLVVEYREVKGQAELDRVAGGQIDTVGLLVGRFSLVLHVFKQSIFGVLSDIAVVVAYHLNEECLGFFSAGAAKHTTVDHIDDLLTVLLQLRLDLAFVTKKGTVELGVLRILLNSGDGAACSAFTRDEIFKSDGEEIALIRVNITTLDLENLVKEVDHVIEALGLFSNAGKENFLFNVRHSECVL